MVAGATERGRQRASKAGRERRLRPPIRSRIAAGGALVVFAATLVVLAVFTLRDLPYVLAAVLAGALAISVSWIAATNRRHRWWAIPANFLLVAGAVASLVAAGRGALAVLLVVFGIALASGLGTVAFRWEVHHAIAQRWRVVPPAKRGVVLMNPRSGDGKVARLGLADEARRRGIEPVVLGPGDDLRALAESAAARGADVLGMAGGDGSQAAVAAVAAAHGLAFVCVPVGTRNHLALDLGADRGDPVRALDAFGPARETTIDLAEVNGEVFVNNVSLGLYARVIASDQYRQAKRRTVAETLPDLLGPGAEPFGFSVESPDGPVAHPQLVQVSNNPYTLSSIIGFGSRARLDTGALGVAALSINRTSDVSRLVALEVAGHPERYPGFRQWAATELVVGGSSPLAAAADGEARTWEPPLRFVARPGALRVRVAAGAPGASAAMLHAPLGVSTLAGLACVVCGRPSGIVAK